MSRNKNVFSYPKEYMTVCELLQLCLTPFDPMAPRGACPAPLSMGFSRQEYWSGEPCPPNSYECMCILYLMENNFFKNIKIKALQVILTCNQN